MDVTFDEDIFFGKERVTHPPVYVERKDNSMG